MNNFDYKYMTPFKWFVLENFPFIENDFDAINNYHLFSKVVEYLNKTIDNVNVLGNLVEQFSDYFDNLDVQEEINNKLDEMVEDGTLQNIVDDIFTNLNRRIDNIDTKVNNMTTATPQGAFNTLEDLETAFPTGTTGIYVISSTNNWYFWNGEEWKNGGNYNQSVIEFPLNVFTNFADFSRAHTSSDKANYGNNILIPSNYVNFIKVKTLSAGNDGKVFIMIPNPSNNKMYVYREYDFVSVVGENIIPINEYIPNDFYILVNCTAIAFYSNSGSPYLENRGTLIQNNVYNVDRKTDLTLAIDVQLNLSYKLTNNIKQLKPIEIINNNLNNFPIIFDLVNNSLKIRGFMVLYNNWNNQISYEDINTSININPLQTGDYNNYYLIYNIITKTFKLIYQFGVEKINNEFNINNDFIVCSISIDNNNTSNTNPPVVYYHSINSNMIKVIVAEATQENESLIISTNKNIGNYYLNKLYKALGDSITRGEDPENSYLPMLNNRYTDIVAKSTGLVGLNYGVGGSTIAVLPNRSNSFWERRDLGSAHIYSIFGGTNDYELNVEMGTINDGDFSHFKYAFYKLVDYFINSGGQCFVITPLRRLNDTNPNLKGYTLKDYVDAEIEICKMFGIPVLDLYNNCEINPNITTMRNSFMPDGLHPNKNGMRIVGNRISSFIKNMLNYGSDQNIYE